MSSWGYTPELSLFLVAPHHTTLVLFFPRHERKVCNRLLQLPPFPSSRTWLLDYGGASLTAAGSARWTQISSPDINYFRLWQGDTDQSCWGRARPTQILYKRRHVGRSEALVELVGGGCSVTSGLIQKNCSCCIWQRTRSSTHFYVTSEIRAKLQLLSCYFF